MLINTNGYLIKLQKKMLAHTDLNRIRLRKPITIMHTSIRSGVLKAHLETFDLNRVRYMKHQTE